MSPRSLQVPLIAALMVFSSMGCMDDGGDEVQPVNLTPHRLLHLEQLGSQLQARSLAHDTAFCDSVLPLFQRPEVARGWPQLMIDAHEAVLNGYGYHPDNAQAAFTSLAAEIGEDRSKAYRLFYDGLDAMRGGDLGSAMRLGMEALPLARAAGDSAAVAKASRLLGALLCDYLGKPDEALPHLHSYFRLSTKIDDRVTAAHFISEAHWQRDELDLAEEQLSFVERNAVAADSAWPGYPYHRMQAAFLRFVIEARRAAKESALPLQNVRAAFDVYIGLLAEHSTARTWNTVSPCVRYGELLISRGEFVVADSILLLGSSFAARCEVCGETMPELHGAFAELYERTGRQEAALARMKLRIEAMARNELLTAQQSVVNAAAATSYEQRDRALAVERARERLRADHQLAKERVRRNIFLIAGLGLLVFGLIVLRQRRLTQRALQRSDELLLNILPEEVAEELKAKGEAEARHIDHVTVLFTDFKGFTAMSEQLSPKELVRDIHECFSAFDHIMHKHGIEKIKTIGDAYMAAGGLPTPNTTHALDVVKAALEIRDFIAEGKALKIKKGLPYFEIRIGIHTGPVVAGIVGVKKFAYDIWGDTVNVASRMESSGEVGQVNISSATYTLVKDVQGLHFEARGLVEAKNKGTLEMYFVHRG